MVKKSLLIFHHRQTQQELMWSGILRVRMSPVHNTKPVLSCFFGKPQPDLLAHPISPRRNTRFPPPPGYTIRSELCIEVQCSHFGMHVDLNFIGSLCFALSHAVRARYSSFNSKPDQSRAEGKASSTENGNKSFSENFSFSLKTLGVWFAVKYSWHLHWCFQ